MQLSVVFVFNLYNRLFAIETAGAADPMREFHRVAIGAGRSALGGEKSVRSALPATRLC